MKTKLFCILILAIMVSSPIYAQDETIPVPTDITVWNGLSLALAFNIVVTVLRALKIVPDGPVKKSIGYILMGLGMAIGGVYAVSSGVTDFIPLITYIAGGGLSGVTAVGLHSTLKNGKEAWKSVKVK